MKVEYVLIERVTQEKGVFLTYRKIEIPNTWWDKLLCRKQMISHVKVFYPIVAGIHMKADMTYVPGGETVFLSEWSIFNNLLNIKDAENDPPIKVEKIYSREPFKCKEGWVNPEKDKEPTGE